MTVLTCERYPYTYVLFHMQRGSSCRWLPNWNISECSFSTVVLVTILVASYNTRPLFTVVRFLYTYLKIFSTKRLPVASVNSGSNGFSTAGSLLVWFPSALLAEHLVSLIFNALFNWFYGCFFSLLLLNCRSVACDTYDYTLDLTSPSVASAHKRRRIYSKLMPDQRNDF
jgi:hypothetical protein